VAIVISKIFDIKLENVKKALVNMKVTEHRMDKFVIGKNITIYDDTYNASYESVKAAIDVISNIKQEEVGRKIYILGDILELGEFSERYHKKIADYLGWGHLYILTHPQVRPDWKAGYEQIGFERDELVSVSHYQSDIGHDELSIRPSDIIDRYPKFSYRSSQKHHFDNFFSIFLGIVTN